MITPDEALLLVFLKAHGADVIPDAKYDATSSLFFHIEDLCQLLAQLVSLRNLVVDKADGDVQVLLGRARKLQ